MNIADRLVTLDEQRLLILAVRTALDSNDREGLQELLARSLDWNLVVAGAGENKVLPLVYRALRAESADRVPEAVTTELRRHYEANAHRNLRHAAELIRLVRRLRGEGIRVLPLKGPLLAKRLYSDLGLRQFGDLDVLVPRAEYVRALAVVEACGYRVIRPAARITPAQRAAQVRFRMGYNLALQNASDGIVLELHWALSNRDRLFPVGSARFWQGLGTTELAGQELPDLSGTDLLRYLCLHGNAERWQKLSSLADLAIALRRYPDVDWAPLLDEADGSGGRRALLLGPFLVHRLLGTSLPPPLAAPIRKEEAALAAAAHLCSLFRKRSNLRWLRFQLRLREGPLAKLDELFLTLMAPDGGAIEVIQLPPRLFPLYYVVRPAQLFAKYLLRRPL